MLGAISSDIVVLNSPTTTVHDIAAVEALIAISKLDYNPFVKGSLATKTDIQGQSPHTLLMKNAKCYQINGLSVLLPQIKVAVMSEADLVLPDLHTALMKECQCGGFDIAAMTITDIFQKNSTLYFSENNTLDFASSSLPGVISRKKGILPWLASAISTSWRQSMLMYKHVPILLGDESDGQLLFQSVAQSFHEQGMMIIIGHLTSDYRGLDIASDSLIEGHQSADIITTKAVLSRLVQLARFLVDVKEIVTIRRLRDVEACVTEAGVDLVIMGYKSRLFGMIPSHSIEFINHLTVDMLVKHTMTY